MKVCLFGDRRFAKEEDVRVDFPSAVAAGLEVVFFLFAAFKDDDDASSVERLRFIPADLFFVVVVVTVIIENVVVVVFLFSNLFFSFFAEGSRLTANGELGWW